MSAPPTEVRYLSELLHDGDAPHEIKRMRQEDPKFDAVMAELVVIKRLIRKVLSREDSK